MAAAMAQVARFTPPRGCGITIRRRPEMGQASLEAAGQVPNFPFEILGSPKMHERYAHMRPQ